MTKSNPSGFNLLTLVKRKQSATLRHYVSPSGLPYFFLSLVYNVEQTFVVFRKTHVLIPSC